MVGGLMVPAYVMLCYTLVHPLIITLWLGFAYTITAVGARTMGDCRLKKLQVGMGGQIRARATFVGKTKHRNQEMLL